MFNKFVLLAKILYPKGRAFKMPFAGDFEKLTNAIALSEARLYSDTVGILDSILPDNANFTIDDATDWERRLGLQNGSASTLSDRKSAIIRKLNAPGINPAKGHALYLENQLQLAGFNVYVYENIAGTVPSVATSSLALEPLQYGITQYGTPQYGSYYRSKVVNRIDENEDFYFDLGGTFKTSFFIGGPIVLGIITQANVPLVRKNEFRELILKLKPVQNCGFLNINYI
jgi:uncharacterized protein YmfQ (DUF2313 family)